ncbi:MAG: phytoene desaturase [Bacteroidota bacterium]|nr:phytoene desaturase [Bacteroidota bacterium]
MLKNKKVVVVGAGVAGMAAAIRLALQGYEVSVFEKNKYPGGKLSAFQLGDYSFDAGPSLFTAPQLIADLFSEAKVPMDAFFSYKKVTVACNYFYQDGTQITAYTEKEKFAAELALKTNEAPEQVNAYLNNAAAAYKNIATIFLNYSLHQWSTLIKAPILKALATLKGPYLFSSLNKYNERKFKSDKLVQLFNRFATYNGSNPYKAPAMISLISHLEQNEGVFYPKGGMISITNALYQLSLQLGVTYHFGASVEKILHSGKQVSGVVVDQQHIAADIVVSNMDVYYTYQHLLKDPIKAKKIKQQERSSSALIFYWGIAKSFLQLDLHNIFFTVDYKAEFEAIFNTAVPFDDPTIYVNITSKLEPGIHAPVGKENWFVMINVPANNGQDWSERVAFYKEVIIQKLSKQLGEDIAPLIEVEEVLTPVSIESKTLSYMGSLYGTSSNTKTAAFMRHPNFTKRINGLYFVGGTVHPGGGIPLCLSSAKIAAQLIKDTYNIK